MRSILVAFVAFASVAVVAGAPAASADPRSVVYANDEDQLKCALSNGRLGGNEMGHLRRIPTGFRRGVTLACLSLSLLINFGQAVWSAPKHSGAELSITMTDSPDPTTVGRNLTYSITVGNGGPLAATDVTVSDELPSSVSFVSLSATQGSCSGSHNVVCSLGSLDKGATAKVEIVVRADQAGDIINTASVAGKQKDTNLSNNQSTASTSVNPLQEADLSITMTDEPDPQFGGGTTTFTITIRNAGPGNVASARVRVDLPDNVGATSVTASQGSCSGPGLSCNLGELLNGNSATVTFAEQWRRCNSTNVMINSAKVWADEPDPVQSNNEATTVTTVMQTNVCI